MHYAIVNKGNYYHTRDGQKFNSEQAAIDHTKAERARLSEQLRRYDPERGDVTDREWNLQQVKAATDSRTFHEKYDDEKWTVKKREQPSALDRMIQEQEARIAEANRYKGLSREEARLKDLHAIRDRNAAEAEAEERRKAHLKAVEPKLNTINELIQAENWNPQSDTKFREQLRQAKQSLLDPDADPVAIKSIFKTIDSVLLERKTLQQAEWLQRKAAAEATLAEIEQDGPLLSDPEPQPKPEPLPDDPHAYFDPMANGQPSESEPERPIVKVQVDREQKPFSVAYELYEAMNASDSFTDDQISEVRQAALSGDESAMESVIDRYAV